MGPPSSRPSNGTCDGLAKEKVYDAIVVGSGAAGGWAAKELTEQGLDVLVLEAGRTVTAEQDFPLPPSSRGSLVSRLGGAFTGQSIQMRCPSYSALTKHFFVNDRENPYLTPRGRPFNWFRGRQVGGRLHTWGRVALRLSDWDFHAASRDGQGVDWPLSYEELAPFYDRVEGFLGLYGQEDGVDVVPDGKFLGTTELTTHEEHFQRVVEAKFSERRVLAARIVRHDSGRIPLTLRAALETGRLTLRSDAVVRSVLTDPTDGKAVGVSYVDRGTLQAEEVRAHLVVLCASTIETLRLLLNSTSPRHPQGLGNSSGKLGHYFMDHVLVGVGGPLPGKAAAPSVATEDPYDFGRATGVYVPRFRNVHERHAGFLRGFGVQGGFGRIDAYWYLFAQGEMLPRRENRVTLSRHRRDAWGVPLAEISCAFGDNERAMAHDQNASMREMAAVAGFPVRVPPSGKVLERIAFRFGRRRLLDRSGAFHPGAAIHEMGGAGMGDDSRRFVLNRYNQCWDAPNVVVSDGASFVSGCSQNITLTIMALTVRACEHAGREYRAGRL